MNSDGPGYQHMDKQGIVDLIMNNEEEDEEEDEQDSCAQEAIRVSVAEALKSIESFMLWYQTQPEATPSFISNIIDFRELATEKRESLKKQPTISLFFQRVSRNENN